VLRALAALRIEVDEVVGTGMGALVGAAFAAGLPPLRIIELLAELGVAGFGRPEPVAAVTDAGAAAARGVAYRDLLRRWLPEKFSALGRPFVCSALSLGRGAVRYFGIPGAGDRTALPDAVYAASCLPGLLEPIELDGERYFDGGLAEPLPLRIADARRAELTLAVDLSVRSGAAPPMDHAARTAPAHLLRQTYDILTHVLAEHALHQFGNRPDVVLVQPAVADIGMLDEVDIEAVAERGAVETQRALISHPITRYLCAPDAVVGGDREIGSPRDHVVLEVDAGLCIHCGICAASCPTGGYAAVEIGSVVRKMHHYECTRDASCQRACPTAAIHLHNL
jgi:predicted acylesterase/phospholipase RssA/NAD-dependent dihydropyrimidine dehydrogenase PreA subunit